MKKSFETGLFINSCGIFNLFQKINILEYYDQRAGKRTGINLKILITQTALNTNFRRIHANSVLTFKLEFLEFKTILKFTIYVNLQKE